MQVLPLDGDLARYRREFELIEAHAHELLDGLNMAQLAWEPTPAAWSIRTCLDHLVVSGQQSLTFVAEAVAEARFRGALGSGPFRYRLFERWFVWLMDAPSRVKLGVPRAYRPRTHRPPFSVVEEFFELQHQFQRSLHDAHGLDLARVRVKNPVTRWIRFSLGQEYALAAAHERRHLDQVRRLLGHSGFPGASARHVIGVEAS